MNDRCQPCKHLSALELLIRLICMWNCILFVRKGAQLRRCSCRRRRGSYSSLFNEARAQVDIPVKEFPLGKKSGAEIEALMMCMASYYSA